MSTIVRISKWWLWLNILEIICFMTQTLRNCFYIGQGWFYIGPFAILSLLFGGRSFSVHHLKSFFPYCHLLRVKGWYLRSNFNALFLPLVERQKKRGKFKIIISWTKFWSQFTIFFLLQGKPSMTMPLSNVVWYTDYYWLTAVAAISTTLIWNR